MGHKCQRSFGSNKKADETSINEVTWTFNNLDVLNTQKGVHSYEVTFIIQLGYTTWQDGEWPKNSLADAGMGSNPGITLLRGQSRGRDKCLVIKRMLQTYMKMHMKAHRPQDMDEGPFLVQVVTSQWQLGQMVWTGSSPKSLESSDGDDDGMIGSFSDPNSGKNNEEP